MRIEDIRYPDDSDEAYESLKKEIGSARDETLRATLLTKGVRVTSEIFPKISSVFSDTLKKLAVEVDVDCYIYNDSEVQAMCIRGPGSNGASLLISSGAVSIMNGHELAFVIGHELGHYIFGHGHHGLSNGHESGLKSVNLLQLSRAAEISADRVGLVASGNSDASIRAIVKTASGLGDEHISNNVASYLEQAREVAQHAIGSIFDTHPMLPLRARALFHFAQSRTFNEIVLGNVEKGEDDSRINERIREELASAIGFRLDELNNRAFRDALTWSLLFLYTSDGVLSKVEQNALESVLGQTAARKRIQFLKANGPSGLESKLLASLNKLSKLPRTIRENLIADLERFASASCDESENSVRCIRRISDKLGIDRKIEIRPWSIV